MDVAEHINTISMQYRRVSWFVDDFYTINNDTEFSSAYNKIYSEKLELNTEQRGSYTTFSAILNFCFSEPISSQILIKQTCYSVWWLNDVLPVNIATWIREECFKNSMNKLIFYPSSYCLQSVRRVIFLYQKRCFL